MADTIWVQATTTDRQVIVSEYNEAHPTDNHELWIAGYPDVTMDDGTHVPGNPPIEAGDTALVRQRIAEGTLRLVEGGGVAARRRIGSERGSEEEQRRQAEDEQKRQAEEAERQQGRKR